MIRGRRLTDKESRLMLEAEYDRVMDRVLSCLSKLKPFNIQANQEDDDIAVNDGEYDYIIGKDEKPAGKLLKSKTYEMYINTGELLKKS